jgi:hypothetical protein
MADVFKKDRRDVGALDLFTVVSLLVENVLAKRSSKPGYYIPALLELSYRVSQQRLASAAEVNFETRSRLASARKSS